jgi:mannose-6-phosphate isomerase
MFELKALKFKPIFKDKIWGGNKLQNLFGFDYSPLPNCGEAWVLSGVPGNESVVSEGPFEGNTLNEMIEIFMGELVGDKAFYEFGNEFPLLIKLLDANDKLSIQVHPDDVMAQKKGLARGKTEMWYVLEADQDAQLINGFKGQISPEDYIEYMEQKKLNDVLNYEDVKAGDAFYIPAGRVHAILPGIVLAEIQQSADVTYRIYDWDRVDDQGKGRELHLDDAMEVIDFKPNKENRVNYHATKNESSTIVDEQYFTTNVMHFDHPLEKNYEELDSFVILLLTEGNIRIDIDGETVEMKKGEVVLLPATTERVQYFPEGLSNLLEVYIKPEMEQGFSALEAELGV